jgi:transcriptional regulator with XRE-family HTH domain
MTVQDGNRAFYEAFGRIIRDARLAAGLTQAQLGSRLDLTRSSIANVESGRQRLQVHQLAVISESLDVEIEKLVPSLRRDVREVELEAGRMHLGGLTATAQKFVNDGMLIAARKTAGHGSQK